eukprot:5944956-Pleurochrysis_carterae.AAC.1
MQDRASSTRWRRGQRCTCVRAQAGFVRALECVIDETQASARAERAVRARVCAQECTRECSPALKH